MLKGRFSLGVLIFALGVPSAYAAQPMTSIAGFGFLGSVGPRREVVVYAGYAFPPSTDLEYTSYTGNPSKPTYGVYRDVGFRANFTGGARFLYWLEAAGTKIPIGIGVDYDFFNANLVIPSKGGVSDLFSAANFFLHTVSVDLAARSSIFSSANVSLYGALGGGAGFLWKAHTTDPGSTKEGTDTAGVAGFALRAVVGARVYTSSRKMFFFSEYRFGLNMVDLDLAGGRRSDLKDVRFHLLTHAIVAGAGFPF